MHFNTIDLTGKIFERLTVLSKASNVHGRVAWNCQCECGQQRIILAWLLMGRKTRSCGCLQLELKRKRMTVHGHARKGKITSEFCIWAGMIQRCESPTFRLYRLYGGRGIQVCERWHKFQKFFDDMGPRPSARHSIDRINNDGHYAPDNCRWATQQEQMGHTGASKMFTINGQSQCVAAWAREYRIKISTVRARLQRGLSIQQALEFVP